MALGSWGDTAAERIAAIEALHDAGDDEIARLYELLGDRATIEREERWFSDPEDTYGQMITALVEVRAIARAALQRFATAAAGYVVGRYARGEGAPALLEPVRAGALGLMLRDGTPELRGAIVALGAPRVQATAETLDLLVEMGADDIVLRSWLIALPPERFLVGLRSPHALMRRFAHESLTRRSASIDVFRAVARACAAGDEGATRYLGGAKSWSLDDMERDPTFAVELDDWAGSTCAPLRVAAEQVRAHRDHTRATRARLLSR